MLVLLYHQLNHSKMLQRFRNGSFLLRRTLGLSGIVRLGLVVILPLNDTTLLLRFLYKGIIIKHNKTEPTYTKTSLFLCEKRRFLWPGLRKEGNLFKLAGPGGLAFFHLTKKEVSKWPMKK